MVPVHNLSLERDLYATCNVRRISIVSHASIDAREALITND